MAYKPSDIRDVFKRVSDEVNQAAAKPRTLTIKSCGTKVVGLNQKTSAASGYWDDPSIGTSKPPRWIVQLVKDPSGTWVASAPGSTIGYYNVSDGTASFLVARVLLAIRDGASWSFPPGFECLLVLTLEEPLTGGSSETITDLDSKAMTVKSSGTTYKVAHVAVVRGPDPTGSVTGLSYDNAVAAVATMTNGTVYDGRSEPAIVKLGKDVDHALSAVTPPPPGATSGPFTLSPLSSLHGVDALIYRQIEAAVNSGKRHIILYGPPGTGKTTIALYAAEEMAQWERGDGAHVMLTASTAWTAQDLVGGYQPLGSGTIGFIEGALLRDFDRPIVIDELNRAPVDKVLGPLFSVLSGQASTLPYREDVTNAKSEFHKVLPKPGSATHPHEHAPGVAWHLICTLNTYDKTQLGQISYALSRRFAWIEVPPPADLAAFVRDHLTSLGTTPPPAAPNPVADMWEAVNSARPIGAAPIIDLIASAQTLDPSIDFFATPSAGSWNLLLAVFSMCILPLMDGLAPLDMERLARAVADAWALDPAHAQLLETACSHFAA